MMQLRDVRGALASIPDLPVTATGRIYVDVALGTRGHRVRVLAVEAWLRVEGRIVQLGAVEGVRIHEILGRLLKANHLSELVGLVRDGDGWLVARCDVPPEAEGEELADAIRRVARVADRAELLWTGGDVE